MDRQNADRFTRGSSPWGAAQLDTPWMDVHGDGYWIRCYRIGREHFEWFLAFGGGQGYESAQSSSIHADIAAEQTIFPEAVLDAFLEIENAVPRLDHMEAGVEIETGLGTISFKRDPFETRETDILHFPRPGPTTIDTERAPHILRLVPNSRTTGKKRRFLPRRPANIFQGSDPWLDYEIDGRLLASWLEARGAEASSSIGSCETHLRANRGDAAGQQLDCLAGLQPHESGRDPWLLGCPCGDPGCGGLTVRITRTEGRVLWSDFAYSWCYGDDDYFGYYMPLAGGFVFDAAQYDAEIADARNRLP